MSLFPIQPDASSGGFRVVAPRLGEALSGTLLNAFAGDRNVPDDMRDLLAQLDKVERVC